jgi:hypothetical protein
VLELQRSSSIHGLHKATAAMELFAFQESWRGNLEGQSDRTRKTNNALNDTRFTIPIKARKPKIITIIFSTRGCRKHSNISPKLNNIKILFKPFLDQIQLCFFLTSQSTVRSKKKIRIGCDQKFEILIFIKGCIMCDLSVVKES